MPASCKPSASRSAGSNCSPTKTRQRCKHRLNKRTVPLAWCCSCGCCSTINSTRLATGRTHSHKQGAGAARRQCTGCGGWQGYRCRSWLAPSAPELEAVQPGLDLSHLRFVALGLHRAVALRELAALKNSGKSATSGMKSRSCRPVLIATCSLAGLFLASRRKRVPARSAAMSLKLKRCRRANRPLPCKTPMASLSGPPPSIASTAEIRKC